jgi:hypothetical protein
MVQGPYFAVATVKKSNGNPIVLQRHIWESQELSGRFSELARRMPQPILLRLSREDDTYFASVKLKGREWIEIEKVRQPYRKGYLVFGTQNDKGTAKAYQVKQALKAVEHLEAQRGTQE